MKLLKVAIFILAVFCLGVLVYKASKADRRADKIQTSTG